MGSDESRFNVSLTVRDKVTSLSKRKETEAESKRPVNRLKKITRKVLLVTLVQLSEILTKVHRKVR